MIRKVLVVLLAFVFTGSGLAAARQSHNAPASDVSGAWNLSIDSPHGKMVWKLSLKAAGKTVTGTIGNEQMGSFEVKGQLADGKLAFKFGPTAVEFEFNGKLKDANSLVGTITGEGSDMACTGERVK